jgi:cell division protein FtsB
MALREKRVESQKVVAELQSTEQKSNNLKHEIEQINSGFGLEKIFRERFNVKKPGEEMFIIVEEPVPASAGNQTAGSGFLRSLWTTVKNVF